jgi:hypothetical protein
MRVTLDIFSGRPNPVWEITEQEQQELIDRVAGRAVWPPSAVRRPKLGFRGFGVAADSDAQLVRAALPPSFYVGAEALPASSTNQEPALPLLGAAESDDTALWLLTTAKRAVDDTLLSYADEVVRTRRAAPPEQPRPRVAQERQPSLLSAPQSVSCNIQNSLYNPNFWNQPWIQPYNNCYNYAMNYPSNTVAQPGRISGQLYSAFTCAEIEDAATADGCTADCDGPVKEVALVLWPGFDFHWYRKHSNGFWAHKVGPNRATRLDSDNRIIGGALAPATCDRGPYTVFCGYRFSPVGMRVV